MAGIKVVNLVVTTDLKHRLRLEKIAAIVPHTEYNPEQFPGLTLRIKEPKAVALLFYSGRVVCTGTKSIEEAKKAIFQIIRILKKVNVDITIKPELKLQNLVGSGELGFKINLHYLAINLRNVEYEPEQFPGLVYRIKKPVPACFLLFSNGKIVCTGTKGEDEMKECFGQLIKEMQELEKKRTLKRK
ncbi:MAG: TATA-box-binding protein [Nanoarchaeota archaeon]|nr:TATA-box-binding protein [Nanoarchaeota archaeon]